MCFDNANISGNRKNCKRTLPSTIIKSMNTIFGSVHTRWIATVALALFVQGCYFFVSDDTPPVWLGDDASVDLAAIAAGTSGPGGAVFKAKCVVCHQSDGKGLPGVYPTLIGSDFATGDPTIPIRIVLNGFQGPIERGGAQFNGVMQPWGNALSDQEIADVLTYVRSSWGNSAAEIDAAAVAAVREATASKTDAYTEDELKAVL
jgi:mono/diheme cytochrome c family protein